MMQGRTPTKHEKQWLDAVTQLGCIVCLKEELGISPASPHHIDGKTKPGAHLLTIPLCWRHHQEGSDCEEWTSRHPHKVRFEARYGDEMFLLELTKQSLNSLGILTTEQQALGAAA